MVRNIEVDFNRLPQIRSDPTIPHRTVIVSTQRQGVKKEKNEKCPFCPGNEEETPKELVRIPNFLDAAKWQVRGFANAFPFLMIEDGNNGNSYSGVCDAAQAAEGMESILANAALSTNATVQTGTGGSPIAGEGMMVTCNDSDVEWAAEAPLTGSTDAAPRMWCVDSAGIAEENTGAMAAATVCP